mmetsp:Transcript_17799/g.38120  ORF Transcript_17799/g.38120 Transcript_17799/m.38120 type:complete len:305 (-) Transcript_17799:184-1098(-)
MSTDGGCAGTGQELEGILARCDVLDVFHIVGNEGSLGQFLEQGHVRCDQPGRPDTIGEVAFDHREGLVHTRHLHTVSRLGLLTKLTLANHLDAARDLSWGGIIRRLLNVESLVVLVDAQTNVHLQSTPFLIFLGHARNVSRSDEGSKVSMITLLHVAILVVLVNMHGLDKFGCGHSGFGDNALNLDELLQRSASDSARSHMVTAERSLNVKAKWLLELLASFLVDILEEHHERFFPGKKVFDRGFQDLPVEASLGFSQVLQIQRDAVPAIGQLSVQGLLPMGAATVQEFVEHPHSLLVVISIGR